MSAIFGIVNLNGAPVDREHVNRMSMALAPHGEEGGSIEVRGSVGLGQRLMRFTPRDSFERQPLLNADNQLCLVSDGRIDNRAELIGELKLTVRDPLLDGPFASIPDGAVILRAYEAWGRECVRRLIGVFAFAIWDERTQTLFAARSPIAAPSLMYSSMPGYFAFATMPGGLHALPFFPGALNERRFADLLIGMGGDRSQTIYRGISSLQTGHLLVAGRKGVETECFWRPDLNREIRFKRDGDYCEAFLDLFGRIVGDHLDSASPVGIQMSGGLDSSSTAVTAARLLDDRGERLAAFTEVPRSGFSGALPPGRYADETPFVRAIAEMHPNVDLILVHTDGHFFLDDLDRLFAHLEIPFRNTSNRVWIEAILRKANQRGVRVLLEGTQGNLTMSWTGSGLIPGLVQSGKWTEALREMRAMVQNGNSRSFLRAFIGNGIMPLLPDPLYSAAEWLRHPHERNSRPWFLYSPIHPDFAADQQVAERARAGNYTVRARMTPNTRLLRYETLAHVDFGVYASAYRAMYGIDLRAPAADVRLAEFCLALPEGQFFREGESRRLIRRAMANDLPATVLANKKRGLQSADWFERLAGARSQVSAELVRLKQCELARRLLDLERLQQMFDRMPPVETKDFHSLSPYQIVFQRGLMVGRFLRWFEAAV